jgi:hypothetical protein
MNQGRLMLLLASDLRRSIHLARIQQVVVLN